MDEVLALVDQKVSRTGSLLPLLLLPLVMAVWRGKEEEQEEGEERAFGHFS